ncbi:hypothetical protein PMI08_03142 [Brevibacillus sp. CF112]|uniref:hypothetical protein n=1 Tax=Brevibacillus sp. CF112 TaxID=1144311 RepID=UPI0002717F5C|nr:hypothetical protein [Brevibacillus sp. CF112]EJL42491.1 hypothetical protein PMI08_03142 [Brevibacillus sp. CF112]
MYTIEDKKVCQYINTGQSSIRAVIGDDVSTIETDTEVIIVEFDLVKGQYVERERMTKVVDDPVTVEDEGQSFWANIWNRVAFWRKQT